MRVLSIIALIIWSSAHAEYDNEINQQAAEPCNTAVLEDTDLFQYVSLSEARKIESSVKEIITDGAIQALTPKVNNVFMAARMGAYKRYAKICIRNMTDKVNDLISSKRGN